MVFAGAIVAYVGMGPVVEHYGTSMGMTLEEAQAIALNDMAAFFIILAGLVGFILMFLANGKAPVLNTYSGSLALTNISSIFGWRGNRAIFVIIANVLGLIMIYGNILSLVENWLNALGVLTTCVATLVLATSTALYFATVDIFPIPFITSTILSLIFYPLLRLFIFKPRISMNEEVLDPIKKAKI